MATKKAVKKTTQKTAPKTAEKAAPKAAPKTTAPKIAAPKAAPKVAKAPRVGQAPVGHGVGRRKSSVARVWLYRGNGKVSINGREFTKYFDTDLARLEAAAPLQMIPVASNYNVEVNVSGGGLKGQAGAVRVGVARALLSTDEALRGLLRQHGFLTVNSRLKERKKYGQKAARRKFQFVKR
jgi:small subunit ribosomal protein S9